MRKINKKQNISKIFFFYLFKFINQCLEIK